MNYPEHTRFLPGEQENRDEEERMDLSQWKNRKAKLKAANQERVIQNPATLKELGKI